MDSSKEFRRCHAVGTPGGPDTFQRIEAGVISTAPFENLVMEGLEWFRLNLMALVAIIVGR